MTIYIVSIMAGKGKRACHTAALVEAEQPDSVALDIAKQRFPINEGWNSNYSITAREISDWLEKRIPEGNNKPKCRYCGSSANFTDKQCGKCGAGM